MINVNDDERRIYGDSTILEPILEQQDEEIPQSPLSQTSFEEEKRRREEIEHFEALEKEFASNRHGIRVKFADDDEQEIPLISQRTVVKSEPFFQIQSSEDQVTKHFYENSFQFNKKNNSPSEPDSLEEEFTNKTKMKEKSFSPVSEQKMSSPAKSILKKSSNSRSPSPGSPRKKTTSTNNSLETNQFPYLAELTAKQTNSSRPLPLRSLFEPTFNIFDSSSSSSFYRSRPSRLRYYIKPYRGEANLPVETTSQQRRRSLSEQRTTAECSTRWSTFCNQYNRPSQGKQHVSWSPVREYIHQGREKNPRKKKEKSFSSDHSMLSLSNPCLPTSSTIIPLTIHSRPSRSRQIPLHFRQSFPPSTDHYETSSVPDQHLSLTPITPLSQLSQNDDRSFVSSSSNVLLLHQPNKEHQQTMQRYDRLLEKMKLTDQQLQQLSKSWNNKTPIKSNFPSQKTTTKTVEPLISPLLLQICLIILVVCNLFLVFFFNEIHFWWNESFGHSNVVQQDHQHESKY